MSVNFSITNPTPSVSSNYVNVLSEINDKFTSIIQGLDPVATTATNVPENTIRWASSTNKWQKWNNNTWNDLSSLYGINISGNAASATILQNTRTINGVSFNGSANITITSSTTQALTINAGGVGADPGITFNGGTARTISYNTVGAPSTTGVNATGTWAINITGNTATATVTPNSTFNAYKIPFANSTANTSGSYGLLQDNESTFTYNPSSKTFAVNNILLNSWLVSETLGSLTLAVGGTTRATITNQGEVIANIFNGRATSANYADLAEKYLPDSDYDVGTVVVIGGEKEITECTEGGLAIGAISAHPAYMMNSALVGGVFVALKGRVPVKVSGTVNKGDKLVAGPRGSAVKATTDTLHNVFAIALAGSSDTSIKLVECLVL
jgi:hypothetical protein